MKFPDKPLPGHVSYPPISQIHLSRDPDQPHVYQQAPGLYSGCATCGGSWRLPIHIEPIGGWSQKEDAVTIDKTADVKPENPEDEEELGEDGKPLKIKSPTVDKTGDVKEKRD